MIRRQLVLFSWCRLRKLLLFLTLVAIFIRPLRVTQFLRLKPSNESTLLAPAIVKELNASLPRIIIDVNDNELSQSTIKPTSTSIISNHEPSATRNHHHDDRRPYSSFSTNSTAMAACMLIRNDNHLLAEWVAYHYTVLPLRHLIVGSDENSTQDPMDVLQRWNDTTDLNVHVWYADPDFTPGIRYTYKNPVYRYVRRQSRFLSKCVSYWYEQQHKYNISWVAMIDSDEYISLNPLSDEEYDYFYDHRHNGQPRNDTLAHNISWDYEDVAIRFLSRTDVKNETLWDRIHGRNALRQRLGLDETRLMSPIHESTSPTLTVLDVLEEYTAQHGLIPCHTMPRIRYSPHTTTSNDAALINGKCHPHVHSHIASAMNISRLNTLRYLHHFPPEQFVHHSWSKVLLDVRRISYPFRRHLNPHLPLTGVCPNAYVPPQTSLLRVHHYRTQGWSDSSNSSAASGRPGDPRHQPPPPEATSAPGTKKKKKGRQPKTSTSQIIINNSNVTYKVTCGQIHGWLNDFVAKVGLERAMFFLRQ